MNTRKHGSGLSHRQVVVFSNRLAARGHHEVTPFYTYEDGYYEGYSAACKYFAHELRKMLREIEYGHES